MATDMLPIPLTTFPVGVTRFGPFARAGTLTHTVLTLDRTVANGLNSNPTTIITYMVERSVDSGVSWQAFSGSTTTGGIIQGDGGVTVTSQVDDTHWTTPQAGGQFRVTVTIAGHSVAVSGSLVVS